MAMLPSSSSFTYDVFLSFRETDTRYRLPGNLYKALLDRGFRTFIGDEDRQRGDPFTASLFKKIEESRIAIVVFSENYASSSFCLNELSYIVDCMNGKGLRVFPVFYNVDPSYVRHQGGTYGKAFARHEERFKDNKERLQKWRSSLEHVANLSGFHFNRGDGYEYQFIESIVKEVSSQINRAPLPVADYPVGLDSRVQEVIKLLDVSSDGVHMIGIHGIGGIGKTTLALAVYNSVADHFDSSCFLADVRTKSNKHGLKHLQEMFLSILLGEKDIIFTSVYEGISIIKQTLKQKKVLLIVDDVDKMEQLPAIVGSPDWCGSGSRVIITTRDKHLLAIHGVGKTYEVDGLNTEDALELLRWAVFKKFEFDTSYEKILKCAVTYASGLPLALKVLGSQLSEKSIKEWEFALDQYKKIPHRDIQQVLKENFDALEEWEQNIFLDIACCYNGYQLREVENILHAHYCICMKYHIQVLVDKSLIKISSNDEVTLLDLIEDMGKEIVRQESPEEPAKRSRLWFHEDIVQVLKENTGTSNIEIIHLHFPKFEEVVQWDPKFEEVVEWDGKAFEKMTNLKTLIIRNGGFSEGPKQFPKSLRVLDWQQFPSKSLPSNFHPKKLAICKLPENSRTSLSNMLIQSWVTSSSLDNCILPGQRIPEWFDHTSRGNSLCFWFRKEFPSITVSAVLGVWDKSEEPFSVNFHFHVKINDIEIPFGFVFSYTLEADHIFVLKNLTDPNYLGDGGLLLKNEWNYGEVLFVIPPDSGSSGSIKWTGVHVNRERTRMEDFRFTNPYPPKSKVN